MIRSVADLQTLADRLKMPLRWLNVGLFVLMTGCIWATLAACLVPLVMADGVSQTEQSGLCITAAIVIGVPWWILRRANKKK